MLKRLFTPGPLNCSMNVKTAMLKDIGSRDAEFISLIKRIRKNLLNLGNFDDRKHTSILMQGSGTFGVEAVISSIVKDNDKLVILSNGAYGERMNIISKIHGINTRIIRVDENKQITKDVVQKAIDKFNPTHIAVIHHETTTGVLNPISEITRVISENNLISIVDSMSGFGAIPENWKNTDFLISSSNKCIQGVPGFSFVIANKEKLLESEVQKRSLSLDLVDQYKSMEENGQFRFTPPTHSLLAFDHAIRELILEGGVLKRNLRYKNNNQIIRDGMKKLGFVSYLDTQCQGPILSSFLYPKCNNFNFNIMYSKLANLGIVLYPGKLSDTKVFRIGNIGDLNENDMKCALVAIENVLNEMNVTIN